jgi:PAS domain S-box-containing protein
MDTNQRVDPEVVLQNWRKRILNGFLAIVAVIVIVMTVVTILDALSRPGQWPVVILDIVLCIVMVGLGIFRGIDYRIRAWGTLLVPYIVGVTVLATFGLGGSGRIYMLAVPIAALILIGARPGMIMSVVSVLTLVAFAILADQGLLAHTLIRDRNSLLLADWLAEFSDTMGLLAIVMAILILFYRFQESLIASERSTHAELVVAQKQLEEQNATLEQKVQERTGELQATNHSLEQRNAALGLLNSISEAMTKTLDVKTLMQLVGDKIRGIFDVDSSMIMLLDRQTSMIHVPYEYDRNEGGYIDYVESFPLGTGLSSKVITTGQPLMANTLAEEIASGAYFPPEIIAKGKGAYGESWLGVPILSNDQVLGLIALADNRPYVFNQNHTRLLQTLSSNLGAAIENARLFDETRRLLKETEQRNHELSLINNIQQGLASKLDFQAVIDLFGDEVSRIYPPQERIANNYSVYIALYDPQTRLIRFPYLIDGAGERFTEPPTPLGPGLTSHVIQSGQPLVLRSAEEQLEHGVINFTQVGEAIGSQSWLGVPIRSGDQVIGVLSMQDKRPNLFAEDDVRLLSTLAASLAVALENARLFEEAQQRAAELAIVNSVQAGLASKLDLQAIYELVGEKIRTTFNAQVVTIATYDRSSHLMHGRYYFEDGSRRPDISLPAFGFRKYVLEHCLPLMINENMAGWMSEYANPVIGGAQPKSAIFIPMLVGNEAMGVVSLQNNEQEHAFSESDIYLLTTLVNSMSVALENARLFNETQRLLKETEQRAAELAIINSVQAGLASKLDMQAIYELVGEKIRETFNAQVVSITTLDPHTELMHSWYYFEDGMVRPAGEFTWFGFRKFVIENRCPLVINNEMERWMVEYENPVVLGAQTKSGVFIPMMVRENAIGVVSLQNNDQENAFPESDVRLLTTLVNSMSVALENARLFAETQRLLKETEQRAAELSTVNTISSAITSELELDALIHLVGEQVRVAFGTDIAYVALLDEEHKIINFAYQYGQHLDPIPYGEGLTSRVIQKGAPLLINEDLQRQREQMGAAQLGRRALSYLGVPIFAGGEAIGVISVQSTTQEGIFAQNDQHLLSTIASNVGIALQNARLFDEIRHQEQMARESAEKLRLIFENAFDGIDVYEEIPSTGQRILVECNDRYCELAGRSREELMAVENTSIFQRDVENPWEEAGRDAILKGEAFRGVFSWIRPDGRENIIEYNAAPTKVGDRYFTIGLDRDVTERMRVENELRESNEKLRLIFENAFDGISIYEEIPEENRRILLDCNDRYCEMAGCSKAELLAIHDTRAMQRDLGVGTEAFGFEPIRAGRAFSGVFSWLRPDGRENIIEYNAAPTQVGGRYFTIGLDRDVTERRHYEAELEKARAAAEAANQAKSAFLANMSHELRTPLNAIIGFTRIVRRKAEGVLPEKQTGNLDKVLASADHLLNLINTVLDIAKIEAGRMDVLAANFRIAALVDLCANTAQPLLKPTVALEKEVDEGLTYVYSDQDKIRQIVLNLLSNAAKFTHEGRILLAARQDGEHLCISVSDTGIGISTEALPRIFKEFQQADNTTTRQYGGTGLGLSISRNLALLLGGDLTVESELGKGSTFTLVIPIRYESKLAAARTDRWPSEPAQGMPGPAQETAAADETTSTKKRLLVIDDDPDAVYLLQENLNPQEYEILGARNGQDGLDLARKVQPQAILLDVVMPGADGWQVLHDLKADQVTAGIPVVFLTIVDKKALGLELGAAAYLLKPLDPVEVKKTLRRVIGGANQPKNVLVIDDDPNIVDMLRQFLPEADFRLEWAVDGIAGLAAMEADLPDILLLDILMPRLDGFGMIEKLRANPRTCSLPIVVISARDLTPDESAWLKETVAVVMKKQGFEAAKLVDVINRLLKTPERQER